MRLKINGNRAINYNNSFTNIGRSDIAALCGDNGNLTRQK